MEMPRPLPAPAAATGGHRPRVLIYAPHLVPLSQPWLRQHAALLPRFETALAGRRRSRPSLDLAGLQSFCLDDRPAGGWEGRLLVLTGRSPALEAFVRHFQPDLIHAHFAPAATEIIGIARRHRIPLVASFHGWDAHLGDRPSLYERRHLRARPRLFAEAALVLAASRALRDRLVELGADPARTEVHYLGIDRDLFDGGPGGAPGGRRIAMVGRLVRSKGAHFALEALALLHRRLPGVELAILGDGPERAGLERKARAAGLPVRFLGAGSQQDARALLAGARVHCFPSTVSEGLPPETFGLAAAEAQAMGVPVVAAATGGIAEVVEDGATGLLVPDASPPALAAALERLLTDDALHARMSAAGRRLVAERFDARTNLARLADRYETLLDSCARKAVRRH
jgi:colanic acid/amylovoran biosynthesis glycosyltransferase